MTKMLALILSFWVLLTSIGIQVFEHFCHEEGASTSYFFLAEDTCHEDDCHKENKQKSCCSIELEDDCCTDSEAFFQLDHDLVNNSPFDFKCVTVASIQISEVFEDAISSLANPISYYPNPPPLSGRDILLVKSVLVI